ncbi:MAG: transcription termination/antitermination protein NusA [Spirochaetes bacterium]|jgi:N utilization substance protein A|nr:transcription termination/antitermination protein NusA [Spirochaetota bacterium]
MASELSDAIRLLVQERGISEDLIRRTIEEFLLAAYKKKFGNSDNAVVQFSDEDGEVTLFAQKEIVDEVYDPVSEIELVEAKEYDEEAEVGDELLIEINPQEFDRVAVQSAKQKARQTLREIQKDTLYSEFSDKVGEMIIGYYQRERNGNIFVDLGKTEGLMPRRYQSPRETYRPNDRIKALIYEVNKTPTGLQIILSRSHTEFVKRVFELEVPEIYDQTVSIFKLVREPGYRTKIAVYSNREDVDPVGACVGLRGVRIQSIVRELEGEKVDILKYENDPRTFIKNALSPAEVSHVVILDEAKRQVLAVVPENQLSLAIGKQGLNVRLANRLADWNIDVKTDAQFAEMDIAAETKRAVSALFGESAGPEEEEEEITRISELPGITNSLVTALKGNGLEYIEDLVALSEEEMNNLTGLDENDVKELRRTIAESVEIIEEQEEAAEARAAEEEGAEQADERGAAEEEVPGAEEAPTEEAPAEEAPAEEPDTEAAEAPETETEPAPEAEPEAEPVVEEAAADEEEEEADEITFVSELPNISQELVEKLRANNIEEVLDLLELSEEQLTKLESFSSEDVAEVRQIISENVEVIEQDEGEEE